MQGRHDLRWVKDVSAKKCAANFTGKSEESEKLVTRTFLERKSPSYSTREGSSLCK